jgi:hypothetical protein
VKENRDQVTGTGIDLLGKVRERSSTAQSNSRRAIAAWNLYATE